MAFITNRAARGLALAFAGMMIFSLTLPATRLSLRAFDWTQTLAGRYLFATAAALLAARLLKMPSPPRGSRWLVGVAAAGLVWGFPWSATLAMREASAVHGGVVFGAAPLATAALAVLAGGEERPPWRFWFFAALGGGITAGYSWLQGGGELAASDGFLLLAIFAAAAGYAAAGHLSKTMDGAAVVCWAIIYSIPLTMPACAALLFWGGENSAAAAWQNWAGLIYLGLFSQLIGFFFWNRGLALGGVSRASQMLLLMPFVTAGFSALLLGEEVGAPALAAAAVVAVCVAATQKMRGG